MNFKQNNPKHYLRKKDLSVLVVCEETGGTYLLRLSPNKCKCCGEVLK
jgi:hypothetical protein